MITIGKNTTISTKVEVLTHDYSIAVGLKTLEVYEPKARFLKPIKIGNSCFIGERSILLPGCEIGDNCIIGSGSIVSGRIPPNSVAVGAPCRVISKTDEWAKKHVMRGDFVDVDVEGIRLKVISNSKDMKTE